MTFEEALAALLERSKGKPWPELEAAVADLHREYDRPIPPPITGTIVTIEPSDKAKT